MTSLRAFTLLLARASPAGPFATRLRLPARDLHLSVRREAVRRGRAGKLEARGPGGRGERLLVPMPVPAETAERLITFAEPAPYGLRDQTLVDPAVRDTWRIEPGRVELDSRRWEPVLHEALRTIAGELGVPADLGLTARLHDLLIYAPGQFFLRHRDSEKVDGMIGTLVVILPSPHTGGAIRIEHHGQVFEHTPSSADRSQLTLLAFFADCQHEVKPIESGYRVVLTYDLILASDRDTPVPLPSAEASVEGLTAAATHYFATPLPGHWSGDRGVKPDRLVYLLDHQYTPRGLSWGHLKPPDAERAALLREVAARAACDVDLALADVHESWQCDGGEYGYGGGYGRYRHEPRVKEAPPIEDLIDWDLTLSFVSGSGRRGPSGAAVRVDPREVCAAAPAEQQVAERTEYEPYMGNWGNTLDRWYHRAAIVLSPRARAFVLRAKSDPAFAIGEVAAALRAKAPDRALSLAAELAGVWDRVQVREVAGLLGPTLDVAAGLGSPERAAALLAPFGLEQIGPELAPRLLAAVDAHGPHWGAALLDGWMARPRRQELILWLEHLPELLGRLSSGGSPQGPALAQRLAAGLWGWARREIGEAALAHLPPMAALALLESPLITADEALRASLGSALAAVDRPSALAVLRRALETYPAEALAPLGLDVLHARCVAELDAELAQPPRTPDDWSLTPPGGCRCELCAELGAFLSSPARRRFEWPLSKERRRHVHVRLADLPVSHQTVRIGSPQTLVLEKQRRLFQDAERARREAQAQRAWLGQVEAAFIRGEEV